LKPLVIYHADCWDGFAAAWIMNRVLENCDFLPCHYGGIIPDVTDRSEVYILDFSFSKDVLMDMSKKCPKITLIDHHKTALEELKDVPSTNELKIILDMNKSGAMLTWEFAYGSTTEKVAKIIEYIQDRDLWKWKLPYSKEFNANLRTFDFDFKTLDISTITCESEIFLENFIEAGKAILRRDKQIVSQHLKHAREVEISEHKVLVCNATVLFSEIAGELAVNRPFGMCWFHRQDGKYQYSLRSDENGVDVSEVAKEMGGGGHKRAAGFETDVLLYELAK
jgi:oligoribonuclease NrnB/cAMP/cGMP phosphodiesterase (DHH superfamily)